jgi:hypothetical protein
MAGKMNHEVHKGGLYKDIMKFFMSGPFHISDLDLTRTLRIFERTVPRMRDTRNMFYDNLAGMKHTQILIALSVHHFISRLRYGWHHVRREKKDLEPEG